MISLDDYNAIQRKKYDNIRPAGYYNGIECPLCGEELIDSNPHYIMATDPPRKNIKCLSCNFAGSRIS